ncbi:M24 family metallopeptidase [Bacillus sp. Marseille-P3661]|uniref:M24 family metallopeptidase n=1 Tax=Bacillus sp. Marseille-P3661 TaxID=1936234 RepID=UPI000C8487D8|nr:Xaa-Pro peptidase family protein [Bacillus sp. Marseille-P3661]
MESQRLKHVLAKMDDLQIDCLVAYFDGIHTFLEPNFVFMLSGFKPLSECMYLLYSDGTSKLIITPEWDANRAGEREVIGTNDLMGTFLEGVKNKEISLEKTGFVGLHSLSLKSYRRFHEVIGNDIKQVDQTIINICATKTTTELQLAEKATWIAERGYERLLEVARPGVTEYELAGEIDYYMRSLGADDNFLLMSASNHNRSVRTPSNHALEPGDIILAEISPSVKGQFSQVCRSVVLGSSNKEQINLLKEKYSLLTEALDRGIKAAVPGEKMSTLVQVMNEPIEKAGYGKYCHPPYMRVRGHGLGLSSILPGDVSLDNHTVLEEGMFFVIHPNQYIPETGYLLCGESVVITPDGAKSYSNWVPSLEILEI